ncbi:MAG TPA: MFS transporter, partial [Kaistiaceae bacterium]|nr:MFS transporter [Kaistiaceae bacterium]
MSEAAALPAPAVRTRHARWPLVVAVVLAAILEVLDTTIVNVAIPHMLGSFGATMDQITWVLTSYIVSAAVVMPLTGYLSTRFGRRNLLVTAIIGFAISSNIVRKVVPSLIEKGSYAYPYLGMTSYSSMSLAMIEVLELPQSTGAYVSSVVQGGPADVAGIRGGTVQSSVQGLFKGGDLIIAVDGQPIK